jgi:hypothetical protein
MPPENILEIKLVKVFLPLKFWALWDPVQYMNLGVIDVKIERLKGFIMRYNELERC